MGATIVLLLIHVPPEVTSVNAVVSPEHTAVAPIITPGNGFTITVVVAEQVVGKV